MVDFVSAFDHLLRAQPVSSHMDAAILEAIKAVGRTAPNPPVGAVVVVDDRVVARGYTQPVGGAHAERHCIDNAVSDLEGGTMYVTLEPCNHTGRTPPCTEAILQAGIQKVVVGLIDPNELVNGRGLQRLRDAGLVVEMEEDSLRRARLEALVRPFSTAVTKGRPYVVVKVATTLDGAVAMAKGVSSKITGDASWKMVHRLRDTVDAIAVGRGTVLVDNPRLTVRLPAAEQMRRTRNPTRVVLDSALRSNGSERVFQPSSDDRSAPMLVVDSAAAGDDAHLSSRGIDILRIPGGPRELQSLLRHLNSRNIHTILFECGPTLLGTLMDSDLIDELFWLTAPKTAGPNSLSAFTTGDPEFIASKGGRQIAFQRDLGSDILQIWTPKN